MSESCKHGVQSDLSCVQCISDAIANFAADRKVSWKRVRGVRHTDKKTPTVVVNDPNKRILPLHWQIGDSFKAMKVARTQPLAKRPAERDDEFVKRIALAYIDLIALDVNKI